MRFTAAPLWWPPLIAGVVLLFGARLCCSQDLPDHPRDCVTIVDVPVYDAAGNRIPWTVEHVAPTQYLERDSKDPGWLASQGFRPRVSGNQISGLPAGQYAIRLRGPNGQMVRRTITVFYACKQRAAQVVDLSAPEGSIGDSAHGAVKGRFTNCRFSGDWWVRLVQMHGNSEPSFEGVINSAGEFEIPGYFRPARYMLVLGFGKEPLFVTGVNLRNNGDVISLAPMDAGRVCPTELRRR